MLKLGCDQFGRRQVHGRSATGKFVRIVALLSLNLVGIWSAIGQRLVGDLSATSLRLVGDLSVTCSKIYSNFQFHINSSFNHYVIII